MKYTIAFLVLIFSVTGICQKQPPDPRDNATPFWANGRIYFKSNRDGGGVYSVKDDGSDLKLLIKSAGDNYPPRWTHDGKHGVFMTSRDGDDFEIYTTNSDGSEQKRLTFNKGYDWDPGWSPDGKTIVFMSSKDGNWEIYKMNADGSDQRGRLSSWALRDRVCVGLPQKRSRTAPNCGRQE